MNARPFLVSLSLAACLAMLCAVGLQRRQIVDLQAERQQSLSEATLPDASTDATTTEMLPAPPVSRELLQLRNQVSQLRRRRDELQLVRAEHEQLLQQVAARGTNALPPPPNYIRKTEARLVGYNSPEDTIQSFLYAVRNQDMTNLLQAFTPEAISRLKWQGTESSESLEKFFQGTRALIGLRIIKHEESTADYIRANIEILPGLPPNQIGFRLIGGEWKIEWMDYHD